MRFGERSFRLTQRQIRELSLCPDCNLPKISLNAVLRGFKAQPHCTCAKLAPVRKRLGSIKEVIATIEQRLDPSVLKVVPRAEARVFPNQILLESTDGDYLVSILKTRVSRRK